MRASTKWQPYVDALRVPLKLSDWTIDVSDAPSETDTFAQVDSTYGQKRATIRLCQGWDSVTPDDQRQTIAHELIHCHLCPAVEMATEDLNLYLSSGEMEMFRRGFTRTIEYAIDALADAISPLLPLPPSK